MLLYKAPTIVNAAEPSYQNVCNRLIDLILYWHLPLFVLYRAAVKVAILDRGVASASGCECIPCRHMDIQPNPHEKEKFQ